MWSDHADLISKAYAGTGALKTDFTRTGKRTRAGAFEDIYKSALRYWKNNYFDGARQVIVVSSSLVSYLLTSGFKDAYDLITGSWIPRKGPSSTLFLITDIRPLVIRSVRRFQ